MDEERLNRLEDKLDGVVRESSELRGEIREFMKNASSYTAAVSAKATQVGWDCDKKTENVRTALDAHKTDADAHGAGVQRALDGKMLGWAGVGAGILAAFGGVIGGVVHKLWSAK
jgi:hypothetical protein